MRHVAIIGAGALGGAAAHAIARRDVARSVTLVDESGQVAAGKALDIAQAAPVEGFATALSGSTDLAAASGADVVVIADRMGAGEWQGEDQLVLLRRVTQMAPRAVIVVAGVTAREMIDRAVGELKLPRERAFGTAPEALAAAAKALVALALDASARDVSLAVVGAPPAHTIVPWEDATIGGAALTRVLDQPTRRKLDAEIAALWPLGPYALAAAAAQAVAAIGGRSRQRACVFVAPDRSDAGRWRTTALPVRLGPSGIVEVVSPSLSVMEKVALDNAMLR